MNQVPAMGLTNIPVVISNQFVYSPSVNRLLQLAANIYDAETNSFYPHVFRPTFRVVDHDAAYRSVFINGFTEVTSVPGGTSDVQLSVPLRWPQLLPGLSTVRYASGVNVYGVPWIIGAKKGFPAFDQFSSRNDASVTRKIQVSRDQQVAYSSATSTLFHTNQSFVMSINNHMGSPFGIRMERITSATRA